MIISQDPRHQWKSFLLSVQKPLSPDLLLETNWWTFVVMVYRSWGIVPWDLRSRQSANIAKWIQQTILDFSDLPYHKGFFVGVVDKTTFPAMPAPISTTTCWKLRRGRFERFWSVRHVDFRVDRQWCIAFEEEVWLLWNQWLIERRGEERGMGRGVGGVCVLCVEAHSLYDFTTAGGVPSGKPVW